jgi:hypothetical protein
MRWAAAIWSEAVGLFVDDGRLAVLVVLWVAACALVLRHLPLPAPAPAVLLFAGLAAILVQSAVRGRAR